jgi:hypothetical protein
MFRAVICIVCAINAFWANPTVEVEFQDLHHFVPAVVVESFAEGKDEVVAIEIDAAVPAHVLAEIDPDLTQRFDADDPFEENFKQVTVTVCFGVFGAILCVLYTIGILR